MSILRRATIALLLVVAVFGVPKTASIIVPPVVVTTKVSAAVYVYEKSDTAVPVGVRIAVNRLNREKKITATLFEVDTVDGTGDVPDQYKKPLEAAKKDGLPALVVMAGDSVVRVVKNPATEQAVMEAVP